MATLLTALLLLAGLLIALTTLLLLAWLLVALLVILLPALLLATLVLIILGHLELHVGTQIQQPEHSVVPRNSFFVASSNHLTRSDSDSCRGTPYSKRAAAPRSRMNPREIMTLEIVLGCLLLLIATNAAFSRIANWRNPPVGQFIEIDGVRLHYIERGKKTSSPLVLLHENGAFLQDMTISGLVDAAAAKFRVVCFDRPGFGHSSRPRLTLWTPERQAVLIAKALLQLDVTNPIVRGTRGVRPLRWRWACITPTASVG